MGERALRGRDQRRCPIRARGPLVRRGKGLALAAALLLSGCGSGGGSGDTGRVLRSPDPTGAQADDAELVQGRDVYEESCASCHGFAGAGSVGPQLFEGETVEQFPTIGDEVELVTEGRAQMPGFESRLSTDEIRAVTRYTREVL